jgi:gluconate 2-dehydrogenase gamma chain
MRRRHFLTLSAQAVGGTLVYSLAREPLLISARAQSVKVPLRFFKEPEALDVAAAAARIMPADETGPGANEAGVIIYIDRQLASAYGRDQYRYTKGPFEAGPPELGWQGKETPRELYRAGLRQIAGLHQLPTELQDAKLRAIETTTFFALLRTHTLEGMFCDPMHGGNAGLIGWQLVGYPGPQMSYRDEIDRHFGQPFRVKPRSLEQITGKKPDPWEDEKG